MIDLIDFSKLKPFKADKKKSFELLCYHIAKREFEGTGKFTPVDDSGGGDGVEFYLTLANGDEWGWQAKFFSDTDRLAHGGRKNQIITSLETACKHHPNLKKWFLCTASTFTIEEQKWFDEDLLKRIPASFITKPEILHWNSSFFTTCFSNPKFTGISSFFFGSLELNVDWFKKRFEENFKTIESKYDPELHSENGYVNSVLDQALINERYLFRWENAKKQFHQREAEYLESAKIIKGLTGLKTEEEILKGKYQATFGEISKWLEEIWNDIETLNDLFEKRNVEEIKAYPHQEKLKRLSDLLDATDAIELDENSTIHDKLNSLKSAMRYLSDPLANFFSYSFDFSKRNITITGRANSGKTHVACDYCKKIIDNNHPVIFIPAIRFSNSGIL